MSEDRGVLYYNTGTACAVRLAVSICSLRNHFGGSITILSEGRESHPLCEKIGAAFDAKVVKWSSEVPPGKNSHFVAKTRVNTASRSELTIALDSDTLVMQPIEELFELAGETSFCVAQFSNWRTSGHLISKRIRQWESVQISDIEPALNFGAAINTGVFAYRKDSAIFKEWSDLALRGRDLPIPDETSCQLLLHRYEHLILDPCWNRSCKYDDPAAADTRIIHFHGRKHCRPGLPYHANLWMEKFESLMEGNVAGIRDWSPSGDRTLKRYFRFGSSRNEGSGTERKCQSTVEARNVPSDGQLRVVLGAGRRKHPGWICTDKDKLDVTRRSSWEALLGHRRASRLMAEHVWEHLTPEEMSEAQALAFEFLAPGGCFRVAVPDKFHPDPDYIARVVPGGSHWTAKDHRQLLSYLSLGESLRASGFEVCLLEYWDERGEFHFRPWSSQDGHIKRSALHDRRNRKGLLKYTSVIVDAWKPNSR